MFLFQSIYKTVFMGTPAFAVPSLRALAAAENVTLVATNPDRPAGRGNVVAPTPVKAEAERLGIPVFQPEKARDPDAVARFAAEKPDLIVVAAYGHILPKSILDIPKYGCINVHASILPRYRGAAPINWAVARGETVTGVTIMKMDVGMDTGPILHVREMPIGDDDTAETIYPRLAELGAQALVEALEKLHDDSLVATPQDDALATMAPMLKKEHGRVDWSLGARDIRNLVRGMTPWPSVTAMHGGKGLRLVAVSVVSEEGSAGAPGSVLSAGKDGVVVACGSGALRLDIVQPEGGKPMPSGAWAIGRRVKAGEGMGWT
ncbi:MAG TPA: methionyl-tRNA formyltransferase [Candidatus Deferrimicrobiaceae bacterium]